MHKKIIIKIKLQKPSTLFLQRFVNAFKNSSHRHRMIRSEAMLCLVALLIAQGASLLQPYFTQHAYDIGKATTLLSDVNEFMAKKLTYDAGHQVFSFNNGQAAKASDTVNGGHLVTATAAKDPSRGITVSDPTNQIDLSLIPKFNLLAGKQDGNRILYPLTDGMGWAVYTMHGTGLRKIFFLVTHLKIHSTSTILCNLATHLQLSSSQTAVLVFMAIHSLAAILRLEPRKTQLFFKKHAKTPLKIRSYLPFQNQQLLRKTKNNHSLKQRIYYTAMIYK